MSRFINTLSLLTLLGGILPERINAQNVDPTQANTVCPPGNREKFNNHVQLIIGLTELPADVAAAIMAGRGHISMNSLESISDEAAATWAGPFANIRLFGLKTLTPAAGASLTKGTGIFDGRNFGPELSVEAAKAFASHEGELKLDGLKEISDDAAKALLQAVGRVSLGNLTTVSSTAAATLKTNPKIALPTKLP